MRTRLHSLGGFCRDIAGSAAVEFALTAPILILLLFGIIETGRALWAKNSLQYAVERDAAPCITHAMKLASALAASA
jgi:Flp pilus assembly protein TadG